MSTKFIPRYTDNAADVPYSEGSMVLDVSDKSLRFDIEGDSYQVGGSYNNLTNLPILNQDLNSLTTPTVNTYYKHTGATNSSFTKNVIYFYTINNDFRAVDGDASSIDYSEIVGAPILKQNLEETGFVPVANTYYLHIGETTANYMSGVLYFYNGVQFRDITGSNGGGGGADYTAGTGINITGDVISSTIKVNDATPDANGNIAVNQVNLANNLVSPDNQIDGANFVFRTAGGEASINDGESELSKVLGNAIAPSHILESLNVAVSEVDRTLDATIDLTTWKASNLGAESGTYDFIYDGSNWTLGEVAVSLSTYGITVFGQALNGDKIVVQYNYVEIVNGEEDQSAISLAVVKASRLSASINDSVWKSSNLATSQDAGLSSNYTFINSGLSWQYQSGSVAQPIVPGNISRIYFNADMPVNDVVSLLDGLDWDNPDYDGDGKAIALFTTSRNELYGVYRMPGESENSYMYGIGDSGEFVFLWSSEPIEGLTMGWNVNNVLGMQSSRTTFGANYVEYSTPITVTSTNSAICDLLLGVSPFQSQSTNVSLATYGITLSGVSITGDSLTVAYTKEDLGDILVATPTAFKSVGFNQFNKMTNVLVGYTIDSYGSIVQEEGSFVCYTPAVGGLLQGYAVYSSNSALVRAGFSQIVPVPNGSVILTGTTEDQGGTIYSSAGDYSADTSTLLNVHGFSTNGYVCVATTDKDTLCVHPRWSGYMNLIYADYTQSIISLPTVDASNVALPYTIYGLSSVSDVKDEINLGRRKYYKRIGHIAYSAQNLADIVALGTDYIYGSTDIFYVLPEVVEYDLSSDISGAYAVSDFGTEEFLGTVTATGAELIYGQNLRDKLRTDVLTISAQTLTPAQKAQIWTNLGLQNVEGASF